MTTGITLEQSHNEMMALLESTAEEFNKLYLVKRYLFDVKCDDRQQILKDRHRMNYEHYIKGKLQKN